LNSLSDQVSSDLSSASDSELQQRKQALQAELEELHVEVASVAEMVVEHELRKPMTDSKDRKEKERTLARAAWLNYVCTVTVFNCKILTLAGSVYTRIHG
jgi:NADP-dependent 3-hydroxy acid dehydrogenase YdfG